MLILLTNDDGFMAEGIKQLFNVFKDMADVSIVAPERERSATGHGITFHKPLRANPIIRGEINYGWSVSGTPADCVKLALEMLLPRQPDLVISGINNGYNLGAEVLYSGTVSAAIEAAIADVPAIAVSTEEDATVEDYIFAAQYIRNLVEKGKVFNLSQNILLNINIPRVTKGTITETRVTSLGVKRYDNVIEKRTDLRGRDYFWLGGSLRKTEKGSDIDITAVEEGAVSITPLQFDLTNHKLQEELKRILK